MPQNISSQKNIIIAVVVLFAVLGGGYYFFVSGQEKTASSGSVDPKLLTPDMRAFYEAKDKINFKDLSFMKKPFYSQLKDNTVEFPSGKPSWRPNPFWAP